MAFFTDNIPLRAKFYISLIIALGGAVLTHSLYQALFSGDLSWLFLAGITIMGSVVPIGIPYAKGKAQSITITASDIFIFSAILLYSPEVAVCVALIDGILGNHKIRKLYRIAFNLSQLSLVTYLSGQLFYFLPGRGPSPTGLTNIAVLFAHLVLCALVYFVLNSGSVALAISLVTQSSAYKIWKQNFFWAWVTNIAGACAATVIYLNFKQAQFFSFGIAIPVVIVIYHAYRMNHQRVETLQESQRFQATLDALASHIAVLDETGSIVAVNAAWQSIQGQTGFLGVGCGIGTNYLQVCSESPVSRNPDCTALLKGLESVLAKEQNNFYAEYSLNAGEQKSWFAARVTRFQGDGLPRVVLAQEDITPRKEAEEKLRFSEERLRQSQKMEAIGILSGGIAHDFNNLLMVISGYADLIEGNMAEDDPMLDPIREVTKAANRAASLTRQLLTFSRKQVLQPRVLDLNGVVADMQKLLGRVIGEDIELTCSFASGPACVKADPGEIEQTIMNLVVNARDAMPRGGKLMIDVQTADLDGTYDELAMGLDQGSYVMIAVSDTGCGMDDETLAHIFEPFFTTKDVGKGTGLGLATVYGIIKQSGGQIFVFSEPGVGTTFKIFLPRDVNSSNPFGWEESSHERLLGTETVLLVEDEAVVRQLARTMLEEMGYEVLEAGSPVEALAISDDYDGRVHLMLTDVVMPGMKGYELAEQLTPARPEMKVLYMSGYVGGGVQPDGGPLGPHSAFLAKPFTRNSLARKLREVLEPELAAISSEVSTFEIQETAAARSGQ